jgi:hypothetical protein
MGLFAAAQYRNAFYLPVFSNIEQLICHVKVISFLLLRVSMGFPLPAYETSRLERGLLMLLVASSNAAIHRKPNLWLWD